MIAGIGSRAALSVTCSLIVHCASRYRVLEGADGFLAKWVVGGPQALEQARSGSGARAGARMWPTATAVDRKQGRCASKAPGGATGVALIIAALLSPPRGSA